MKTNNHALSRTLSKVPTGIQGLDEITGGGFPKGRPTLVCGSAGCGKTLLGMEFLVRGAVKYNEPGVFMAFEETPEELAKNVRSLGFDLDDLIKQEKLVVDFVRVERSEIEETGDYDLEGLFVRLGYAIDSIGAKRVVLDTIETLFAGLSNEGVLRAELRRLFRWLKDKGVTAVITGERGQGQLTRQGLEEYVSDCVILLDHRVTEQVSTRRLRVVKYRGTVHGTNEYPFLIDEDGISILPITSMGMRQTVSNERLSSGVTGLDAMLEGEGYFRGSAILISGTAGSGKSSVAAHFAKATCERGERCLYFAFEESAPQIIRNMRSIGLDLQPYVKKGLLNFQAARSTVHGLEMHLVACHKLVQTFHPKVVILDPIGNLNRTGSEADAAAMLTRLMDYLKEQGITVLWTSLTSERDTEQADVAISSLVDTWLFLRDVESVGERNRAMHVLKSRGMAHSNQIREFVLSSKGIELADVYLGPEGVLMGSARVAQEARAKAETLLRQQDLERSRREIQRKREILEARVVALRKEFEAEEDEANRNITQEANRDDVLRVDREEMGVRRGAGKQQNGSRPRLTSVKTAGGRN